MQYVGGAFCTSFSVDYSRSRADYTTPVSLARRLDSVAPDRRLHEDTRPSESGSKAGTETQSPHDLLWDVEKQREAVSPPHTDIKVIFRSSCLTISRSLFYLGRPSAPYAVSAALRRSCTLPPSVVPPSASGAQARRGRRRRSEGQGAQGGDARSGMGREVARCGCRDLGDDWSVSNLLGNCLAFPHAADNPATLSRHRTARAGA